MEDTIENKARFFALYWGREFIYSNDFGNYKGVVGDFHFNDNIKQKAVMRLKPLSSITPEQAVDVANILTSSISLNKPTYKVSKGYTCDSLNAPFQDLVCIEISTYIDHPEVENHAPYILVQIDTTETDIVVGYFSNEGKEYKDDAPDNILHAYDYLRSLGYALPFMGVSVEELVERGWIKLT